MHGLTQTTDRSISEVNIFQNEPYKYHLHCVIFKHFFLSHTNLDFVLLLWLWHTVCYGHVLILGYRCFLPQASNTTKFGEDWTVWVLAASCAVVKHRNLPRCCTKIQMLYKLALQSLGWTNQGWSWFDLLSWWSTPTYKTWKWLAVSNISYWY